MSVGAVLRFCHLSGKLLLGVGCSHHTWAKSGTRTSFSPQPSVPVPGLLWYHAAWMELFCSWWLPCDGRNIEVLSSGQKQTLSTCIICLPFFFYIFSKLDAYILSWEGEEDILSSDTSQSRSLPIYIALFNFFCCFYFSNKLKYLRRSVLEQRIIWGSSTAALTTVFDTLCCLLLHQHSWVQREEFHDTGRRLHKADLSWEEMRKKWTSSVPELSPDALYW